MIARLVFLVVIALAVTVVAVAGLPPSARPALACTGAYPPLDESAGKAETVAVVTILAAGGTDLVFPAPSPTTSLTAAPQFPTGTSPAGSTATSSSSPTSNATPTLTPTPDADTLARLARNRAALLGLGARARVDEVWAGTGPPLLAPEIDLDLSYRKTAETQVRQMESNPRFVLPCPIGFLVPRYEQGHAYVVFLNRTYDDWVNINAVFEVDAAGNVSFDYLWMSSQVHNRFFPAFEAMDMGLRSDGTHAGVVIPEGIVPLQTFRNAILYARGDTSLGLPSPALPRPPGVGDAGLLDWTWLPDGR